METSYSAFGASSQLAKNQLNSQQRFACCCRFTRLIDHGHGTRASPWRPLTREENFYIAFPTSLDCLSPPFPPQPSRWGRRTDADGAWTLFRFRDETWQAAPPPSALHCQALLCRCLFAPFGDQGRVESYFSPQTPSQPPSVLHKLAAKI